MSHLYWDIVRCINRMGPQEWFWVLAAVIVVGVLCLRGFGSRSRY
jgi:hypothetical protein